MEGFEQFTTQPPSLEELHKALCDEFEMEHTPESLKQDLEGNAANVARKLAELMGNYAQVIHGTYQGFNIDRPLEGSHPHSWVNHLGTVVDPLKWRMEGKDPYIFVGEPIGTDYVYDEDYSFRQFPFDPPAHDPEEFHEVFKWTPETRQFLAGTVFGDHRAVDKLTKEEIRYLADIPFQYLLPFLPEIYQMLIEKGYGKQLKKMAVRYHHTILGEKTDV